MNNLAYINEIKGLGIEWRLYNNWMEKVAMVEMTNRNRIVNHHHLLPIILLF